MYSKSCRHACADFRRVFETLEGLGRLFGGAVHHKATKPLGQGKPHDKCYCALPTMSLVKYDNA